MCRIFFSYSLRLFIFVCFFVFARFNFNAERETFVLTYSYFSRQTYIDVLFIQHQNWSGRGQSYSLFTVNDGIYNKKTRTAKEKTVPMKCELKENKIDGQRERNSNKVCTIFLLHIDFFVVSK